MKKNKFENLRDEFDRLGTDEKFQFAVEAIIRTIGDVANKAADAVHRDDAAQNVADAFKKMTEDFHSAFQSKKTPRGKRPRKKNPSRRK